MSNGFVYWYERGWSARKAAERVAALESAGLSLAHTATGRITAISSDPDTLGDQITTDRAAIAREAGLESRDNFSFQYWIGLDNDVFCTVQRVSGDLVLQSFYLDGMTFDEQDFVINTVFDLIRESPDSTVGIVVDRRGGSEEEDWDAVIAGAPVPVRVHPHIVGLRNDIAARHPELPSTSTVHIGDLTIYDYGGVLPADTRTS